jgi:hypothetical protein
MSYRLHSEFQKLVSFSLNHWWWETKHKTQKKNTKRQILCSSFTHLRKPRRTHLAVSQHAHTLQYPSTNISCSIPVCPHPAVSQHAHALQYPSTHRPCSIPVSTYHVVSQYAHTLQYLNTHTPRSIRLSTHPAVSHYAHTLQYPSKHTPCSILLRTHPAVSQYAHTLQYPSSSCTVFTSDEQPESIRSRQWRAGFPQSVSPVALHIQLVG